MATKQWVGDKLFIVDEEVADEIERLTAENKVFRKTIDTVVPDQGKQIKRLQARVETLEGAIRECIREDDSYYNVTADLAKVLAATEQGESDG